MMKVNTKCALPKHEEVGGGLQSLKYFVYEIKVFCPKIKE
jgi:hypothetical protein